MIDFWSVFHKHYNAMQDGTETYDDYDVLRGDIWRAEHAAEYADLITEHGVSLESDKALAALYKTVWQFNREGV